MHASSDLTNKYRQMKLTYFFIVFLMTLFSISVNGQIDKDSTLIYQIETLDGNVFVGKVVSSNESIIVLRTENFGTVEISRTNIRKMKEVEKRDVIKGEVWPENPHASRYFYLPNGYGLKAGEGYYQNTWVLFNQVSYWFTNNFSMGVGMIPAFLFGARGAPVWFTPKLSFPLVKDKWSLGTGAIVGTYFGESSGSRPVVGMIYGVTTHGTRDKNFTAGAGFAFADDQWANTPIISLGGTIRTGRKHYFLTENYFFFGDGEAGALLWLGGRFASRHLAVDYGGIIPAFPEMDRLIIIPWLSVTVPFGKN